MQSESQRPWSDRANEPLNGHWADFAAWESWFDAYMDRRHNGAMTVDDLSLGQSTLLYCLCCDVVNEVTEQAAQRREGGR